MVPTLEGIALFETTLFFIAYVLLLMISYWAYRPHCDNTGAAIAAPDLNAVPMSKSLPAMAMVEDVGQAMAIMAMVPNSHGGRTAYDTLVCRALAGGAAFTFVSGPTGRRCRADAIFGCAVLHICVAVGVG